MMSNTEKRASRPQTPTQQRTTQDTDQSPSGQPGRNDVDSRPFQTQNEEQEEEFDPTEDLPGYDWEALEGRYHAEMEACRKTQEEHMEEWNNLMNVMPSLLYNQFVIKRDNEMSSSFRYGQTPAMSRRPIAHSNGKFGSVLLLATCVIDNTLA